MNNTNIVQMQEDLNNNQYQTEMTKRHRRSKHETEGRIYTCEYCQKSYLSKPALNNHLNTKHEDILSQKNIPKRSRGRPKKYIGTQNNYEKDKYEKYFIKKENRSKKQESPAIDTAKVSQDIFDTVFAAHKGELLKELENIESHPILSFLKNKRELNLTICDDIMCSYLDSIIKETNENYFEFIVKFIVLFRESINVNKKDTSEKEFTASHNAEGVPDQCNEFFSTFLEKNDFDYGDFEKAELIELIQHFCYWLFLNGYTKSKLSLAS